MDDEELEKIKKKLENTEFNNDEDDLEEMEDDLKRVDYLKKAEFNNKKEDQDIMEDDRNFESKMDGPEVEEEEVEEDEEEEEEVEELEEEKPIEKTVEKEDKSFVDEKDGNSNKLIIILCVIIAILLLIVIGILVIPKGNKNSHSSNSTTEDESIYEDEGKPTTPKVDISKGNSQFINDNYIYLKIKNSAYITGLDGKVIYQDDDNACTMMSNSYFICERNDNNKTKYVIKKIDESGNVESIVHENEYSDDGRIVKSGSKVIGYYSEDKMGTHIAVLNGDSIKEGDFDYYLFNEGDSLTRKVYGGRYAIIMDSSKKNYGIYDITNNSVLIKPKYEEVVYLYDDLFVAVKNDKSGIVNTNDNVKLDFKYDAIEYSNGLYFAGTGTTLHVLDSNFIILGNSITVNSLSNYKYYSSSKALKAKAFEDKVILFINSSSDKSKCMVIDKNGKSTEYDFQEYAIVGNKVVTLKDKALTLYDSSFNKIQEFTVPNDISIDLNTVVIYLEDNLVFNGCYVFDINSGNYLYKMNNISRSYQGYFVNLDIENGKAKATVSLEDKPVGTIDDIDVSEFLKADNNGIRVTNEYFIFHVANKTLILKR